MLKVSYAVLHTAMFVEGCGNIIPTLSPANFGAERQLELFVNEERTFFTIKIKGRDQKNYVIETPATNLSHWTLAPK